MLKEGKSPGNDNIPSELIKHRGNSVANILTVLCQKSLTSKTWKAQLTQSLVIPITMKCDLNLINFKTTEH